jgi:hypothetical protein
MISRTSLFWTTLAFLRFPRLEVLVRIALALLFLFLLFGTFINLIREANGTERCYVPQAGRMVPAECPKETPFRMEKKTGSEGFNVYGQDGQRIGELVPKTGSDGYRFIEDPARNAYKRR